MSELAPDDQRDRRHRRLVEIGRTVFGPYLVDFCRWLHARKDAIGDDAVLLFAARDAYLPLAVYRTLFPEESDACAYLLASRFSARLMSLDTIADAEQLCVSRRSDRPSEITGLVSPLFDANCALAPSDLPKRLLGESPHWRQRYRDHLRGLVGRRHPIIVDIGYRASTQALVAQLLGGAASGLYLVTHDAARSVAQAVGTVAAYDADFVSPHFSTSLISRHRYLFETILAEPAGTFLAFDSDGHPHFEPFFANTTTMTIAALTRGVMDHASEARTQTGSPGGDATTALARLLNSPSAEEAEAFVGLAFDDRFMGIARRYLVIPPDERAVAYALWREAQHAIDEQASASQPAGLIHLLALERRVMRETLGTAQYACYATNRPLFLRESGGLAGLYGRALKGGWTRWRSRQK